MGKRDRPGYSSDYYRDNSDHLNVKRKKRRFNAPWIHLRQKAKERAKKQGVPFGLTLEETRRIVEPMVCECCGRRLAVSDRVHTEESPSLDRFDPSRGYTKENVAVLCYRCNYLKADASVEEIRRILNWMVGREARLPVANRRTA